MGRESPRPVDPSALRSGPAPTKPTLDEVYRSSFGYILGMAWRLGIAERDREDVAHEVFLVVQRRLAAYDPSLKLTPWLGAITWHVAMRWKELARNHRLELGMNDEEIDSMADESHDPERLLAEAEVDAQLRKLTRAILQAVPEERRIVLILHDLDEIRMPDVARALGIFENTGWDRLRRARRDFEAALRRVRDRDVLGESGIRPTPLLLLPSDPRSLLGRLRDLPEVPAGLEERLWQRLQCSAPDLPRGGDRGGPSAPPRSPVSTAAQTKPELPRLMGAKLAAWSVLVFLLGGAAGALLQASATADRTPPHASMAAVDRVAAVLAPIEASTGAIPTSAATPTVATAPVSSAVISATADSGEGDTDGALVRRAGAALSTGQAAAALTLLQRHAQKYPRSARGQEREALTVEALALLPGRRAEAIARAEQFRRSFPQSVFVPAIGSALRSSP